MCSNAVVTTPSPPPASRRRARRTLHRQVVGLGAAAGEHDLVGPGAEARGDLLPGLLERGLGGASDRVGTRGVPEVVGEERCIAATTSGRTGVVAAWSR